MVVSTFAAALKMYNKFYFAGKTVAEVYEQMGMLPEVPDEWTKVHTGNWRPERGFIATFDPQVRTKQVRLVASMAAAMVSQT